MKRRDLIGEILAKKRRSEHERYTASFRLSDLFRAFSSKEPSPGDNTQASLHVVGIAGCIEVAVRETVRSFVDHGSPYLERVRDFREQPRFDIEVARALHDRRVILGDLVSHLFPLSGVDHINSHLTTILGRPLHHILRELKEFVEPPESAYLNSGGENTGAQGDAFDAREPVLMVPDVEGLMKTVGQVFQARHLIAHEAKFDAVSREDLRAFFDASQTFVNALNELTEQELYPSRPRTALGMSIVAAREAEEVRHKMERTFNRLLGFLSDDPAEGLPAATEQLKKAQAAFEAYLGAEIGLRTSSGKGEIVREPATRG